MIDPVTPIYKAYLLKQPNQDEYSPTKKAKKTFKDILEKEISSELGSKLSVRV